MKNIVIKVSGMSCGHCQKAVKEAICELNGVSFCDVSLERGEAEVTYDESTLTPQMLTDAIVDAGYEV